MMEADDGGMVVLVVVLLARCSVASSGSLQRWSSYIS